jgi:hypothetical protein
MSEDIKSELRQLMMLISDIRSKDGERYDEHIKFSNEVMSFIKNIQENINKSWAKIEASLNHLDQSIETSLEGLLTGINPEGLKETSKALKDIMDNMGKSIQALNLENLMIELRGGASGAIKLAPSAGGAAAPAPAAAGKSAGPAAKGGKTITTGGAPYAAATAAAAAPAAASSGGGSGAELVDNPEDYTPEELEEIRAAKEIYGMIPPHLVKKKKKKKEDTHLLKPSDFFGM